MTTGRHDTSDEPGRGDQSQGFSYPIWAAIALCAGIMLDAWGVPVGTALCLAVITLVGGAAALWRGWPRTCLFAGLLTIVLLGSAWHGLAELRAQRGAILQYVGDEPQLARVTGRVCDEPWVRTGERGAFGTFGYAPPATLFTLELETIEVEGQQHPIDGLLLVNLGETDHRLAPGLSIAAAGWLGPIRPPRNPGEFDFRTHLYRQGVHARLNLADRDNWRPIDDASSSASPLQRTRQSIARAAHGSLRLGIPADDPAIGLLDALLLGQRTELDDRLEDAFRTVGLSHLLSISGAHLGILLGLVWVFARLVLPNPPRVAMVVLIVLGLYLLTVPVRVPILRAAIMAGVFCVGYMTGRRTPARDLLAWAAIVVLVWRPYDLFSPGFQLSFVAVGGILLFTQRVSDFLWPRSALDPLVAGPGHVVLRWAVDYIAVSLVAFVCVLPIVAYHFQIISPLAVLLSVLSLPALTLLLALGYLKIVLGLLLPSVSVALAGPLTWTAGNLTSLVDSAAQWPGAAIWLPRQPSVAWVVGALAVACAILSGKLAHRRGALLGVLALWVGWTAVSQTATGEHWLAGRRHRPAAVTLSAFAVGDGSCYLLRTPSHTLMFDCGSQNYLDIAPASIVPALRALGVGRIDTLMLSHADLDHFAGAVDLCDQIPVGRVLAPPQLLELAQDDPGGATGHLAAQLRARGFAITPASRGWAETHDEVAFELIWPNADWRPARVNDGSLVLSIRAAGWRVLLCGDIQQEAITALLASGIDLRADAADLPHHGSFVGASSDWIAAVRPGVVLQSSGPARLRQDRWAALLDRHRIQRWITDREGMIELRITPAGAMHVTSLKQNPRRDWSLTPIPASTP